MHIIAYSENTNEGYLTPQGIDNLRSEFARDIFSQDLISVYQKQTEHRDELRKVSRERIEEIVCLINEGGYDNPVVEEKLALLAERLSRTKGKKQYGYLKSDVKAIVPCIYRVYTGIFNDREFGLSFRSRELRCLIAISRFIFLFTNAFIVLFGSN